MAKLAFYTFGIFQQPRDHEQIKGFRDRSPRVFDSAQNSQGYVAHAPSRDGEQPDPRWGQVAADPRFRVEGRSNDNIAALSLWEDLESVYAFTYYGRHAEALSHRKEWFLKPAWPSYVAWWVEDGEYPAREEAVKRLEHLHDHGPTPYAFNFKTPFDAKGQPAVLDREEIQRRACLVDEYARNNPTEL